MKGIVTISLRDYDYLKSRSNALTKVKSMLKRAKQDGEVVMTEELKQYIEEIYQELSRWT